MADVLAQLAGSSGADLALGVEEAIQELAAKQAAHLAANPPPLAAVEAPAGQPAAGNGAASEAVLPGAGAGADPGENGGEKIEEDKKAAEAEEAAAANATARCEELFAKLSGEGHDERVLEMLSTKLGRSSPY